MAITAAAVEANGWVLRLTVTGSLGSFASYALDPDGSPRLLLASSHPGYTASAGIAIATPFVRSLAATRPLRRPVSATNAGVVAPSVVDETDLGAGSLQVRIALHEHVYATDTGLGLTALSGWRTGEGAASIAVTNNSTVAAPVPILRWGDTPYRRANGAFDLELMVFSHHPKGLQPAAGVRFTVTDGSNTKTVWATALTTSTKFGDNLRCYRATINAAAAPALTAGLLRCDAEVHPWLGAMRSTDAAGTRSMSGLGTAGFATMAQSPFVVAWDPAASRYGDRFVCVDPAGTTTASAVTVAASWAAAKAGTRAANLTTAIQAGYLNNRSLAAANGQPLKARSVDGLQIGLVAGTHPTPGATAITTGVTADESWLRVFGDPDNADSRANVVLQTAAGSQGFRLGRLMLANLTLEIGSNTLSSAFPTYWALDNIEVRGKAGQETNTVYPASAAPPANQAVLWVTGCRYWRSGSAIQASSGFRPGLVRASEFSRRADAITLLTSKWLVDATVTGAQTVSAGWQQTLGDVGSQEDVMFAGNDFRSTTSRAWLPARLDAAKAGTAIDSIRRNVFANNLVERIGSDPQPFWSMGEDDLTTMTYNIIEGNSFAGERSNLLYSDPLPATAAETDSQTNTALVNRVANNAFDWAATKHDTFDDPTSRSLRVAASDPRAHGYRPQAVGCWAALYGVGFDGNADFGRHGSAGNFQFEYFGRRSFQAVGGTPLYASDRSKFGSNAGGGDYKPAAASLLIGRGLTAGSDRDRTNAVRPIPFSAGSSEGTLPVVLTPAGGIAPTRAQAPALGWGAVLAPARAAQPMRAAATLLGWSAALAPVAAGHPQRAGPAALGWSAALAPAGGQIAQPASVTTTTLLVAVGADATAIPHRASASVIGWSTAIGPAASFMSIAGLLPLIASGTVLWPGSATLPVAGRAAAVRADLVPHGLRILPVHRDRRSLSVDLT